MQKFIAIVLVFAAPSTACFGQITYLSQDRWISADTGTGGTPVSKSATDFEPFDEKVTTNYSYATQVSTLSPWLMHVNAKAFGQKYNGWCGSGASNVSVTFVVTEPTPWKLAGSISVSCSGSASWSLTGPGVNLGAFIPNPNLGVLPVNGSGVLDPGTYVIKAFAETGCHQFCAGYMSCNFNFFVGDPCEADCDANAQLSIDDFICFMTTYSLGEASADCDGDGSLTIDDFVCFQTAFALGC